MEEEKKTRIKKEQQGYGHKYTDLAQIHEYLEKNDMSYYQYVDRIDNDDYIMTVPIINGKEQTARRGVKIVDAVLQGIKNPAQEQGSATTYARRYSLLMAFGLATEDDDGQALSKPQKAGEPKKEIKATAKQKELIAKIVDDIPAMLEYYKIDTIDELTITQASEIIKKKGDK